MVGTELAKEFLRFVILTALTKKTGLFWGVA